MSVACILHIIQVQKYKYRSLANIKRRESALGTRIAKLPKKKRRGQKTVYIIIFTLQVFSATINIRKNFPTSDKCDV